MRDVKHTVRPSFTLSCVYNACDGGVYTKVYNVNIPFHTYDKMLNAWMDTKDCRTAYHAMPGPSHRMVRALATATLQAEQEIARALLHAEATRWYALASYPRHAGASTARSAISSSQL